MGRESSNEVLCVCIPSWPGVHSFWPIPLTGRGVLSASTRPVKVQTPACLPDGEAYTATMRYSLALGMVLLAAWSAAAAGPVRSSVQFKATVQQKLFLPGEPIPVDLSLLNNSGETLKFRPEDGWLDFTVVNQTKVNGEGVPVAALKPVMVNEPFSIEHTATARMQVDLMPCFDLSRPGRYKVTAAMMHQGATEPLKAETFVIEVTSGFKIDEQEFGFRPPDGDAATEVRRYSLMRLTLTTPSEIRLYASVTDAAQETIIRQVKIGRVSGNDKPPTKLDRLSNWHILHQSDSRIFTHTVISPRGDLLVRESFMPTGPRPGLKVDENGEVSVSSGQRLSRADDVLPIPLTKPATPALATP